MVGDQSRLSIGEDGVLIIQLESENLKLPVNSRSRKCEVGVEYRHLNLKEVQLQLPADS